MDSQHVMVLAMVLAGLVFILCLMLLAILRQSQSRTRARQRALARLRNRPKKEHHKQARPQPPLPTIQGKDYYEKRVVGTMRYQDVLERICGGKTEESAEEYVTAVLVLEDDNPKDNQAVRVEMGGATVGYLSRRDAREYREWLQRQGRMAPMVKCKAVIVGGWDKGDGDEGHFGVRLDL
jgi:hypothetical protein